MYYDGVPSQAQEFTEKDHEKMPKRKFINTGPKKPPKKTNPVGGKIQNILNVQKGKWDSRNVFRHRNVFERKEGG